MRTKGEGEMSVQRQAAEAIVTIAMNSFAEWLKLHRPDLLETVRSDSESAIKKIMDQCGRDFAEIESDVDEAMKIGMGKVAMRLIAATASVAGITAAKELAEAH
jgi:predicted transcriptional regulator